MSASKRIRFMTEREGLTLHSGKILEKKLEKAKAAKAKAKKAVLYE